MNNIKNYLQFLIVCVKIKICFLKNTQCILNNKYNEQILKFEVMGMKHYESLLDMGCFSREQLTELVGTSGAANMIIYEYQKKGLIEKIKRDFYAVISIETKQPVLSRYQIGSHMFPDACITLHSAFEVFGYTSQVFYECYVATDKRFSDFEYNGVLYRRIERKKDIDIIQQGGICVTSIEQTVVDSIRYFEKVAGIEEVIRCLVLIPSLDENKILKILAANNNGFLYQKCGYIFEELNKEFSFSDKFFSECERHSSGAKRYFQKESKENIFNERWRLYTPTSLKGLIDKGVAYYDAIG
jgi:predicted transcriptional regulator of viral defense system